MIDDDYLLRLGFQPVNSDGTAGMIIWSPSSDLVRTSLCRTMVGGREVWRRGSFPGNISEYGIAKIIESPRRPVELLFALSAAGIRHRKPN